MKKILIVPVMFAVAAVLTLSLYAATARAEGGEAEKAAAGNDNNLVGALLEEMYAIDAIFRDIVSNVALGRNEAVVETLDHLHGKREKTEEALHAKKIILPKNPDKITLFKKQDMEFHADLRMLERAARKNEQDKMITITQRLLGRCVECHNTFRK